MFDTLHTLDGYEVIDGDGKPVTRPLSRHQAELTAEGLNAGMGVDIAELVYGLEPDDLLILR